MDWIKIGPKKTHRYLSWSWTWRWRIILHYLILIWNIFLSIQMLGLKVFAELKLFSSCNFDFCLAWSFMVVEAYTMSEMLFTAWAFYCSHRTYRRVVVSFLIMKEKNKAWHWSWCISHVRLEFWTRAQYPNISHHQLINFSYVDSVLKKLWWASLGSFSRHELHEFNFRTYPSINPISGNIDVKSHDLINLINAHACPCLSTLFLPWQNFLII